MTEKEKPAYLGHRERVREKIEEFGFDNVPETDLLEYLLFFALPRRDTYKSPSLTLGYWVLKSFTLVF